LLGQQAKDTYGAVWAQRIFLKKLCSAVCEQGFQTQRSLQTSVKICYYAIL